MRFLVDALYRLHWRECLQPKGSRLNMSMTWSLPIARSPWQGIAAMAALLNPALTAITARRHPRREWNPCIFMLPQ